MKYYLWSFDIKDRLQRLGVADIAVIVTDRNIAIAASKIDRDSLRSIGSNIDRDNLFNAKLLEFSD